jgi:hypothetical protein
VVSRGGEGKGESWSTTTGSINCGSCLSGAVQARTPHAVGGHDTQSPGSELAKGPYAVTWHSGVVQLLLAWAFIRRVYTGAHVLSLPLVSGGCRVLEFMFSADGT